MGKKGVIEGGLNVTQSIRHTTPMVREDFAYRLTYWPTDRPTDSKYSLRRRPLRMVVR